MDAQELRELATNALTGHWPKHLGVNTDAERIEFLARKLESAADNVRDFDAENDGLQKEVDEITKERDKSDDK